MIRPVRVQPDSEDPSPLRVWVFFPPNHDGPCPIPEQQRRGLILMVD
jgi:hypothetical protein